MLARLKFWWNPYPIFVNQENGKIKFVESYNPFNDMIEVGFCPKSLHEEIYMTREEFLEIDTCYPEFKRCYK